MPELAELDRVLDQRAAYFTLEPGKTRALLPTAVLDRVVQPGATPAFTTAFIEGFVETVDAMLEAFPDNLLWDLEALAASVWAQGREADEPAAVRQLWTRVAELQHLFGVHGPIRFRYIHDFVYGYDWARWVAEEPETRADIGPYDAAFVERMHRRGAELLALIDAGDAKYGPLQGDDPRNPFGFSREPKGELALHRHLAAAGDLPVQAWSAAAVPDWRRDYGKLREDAAAALRNSA